MAIEIRPLREADDRSGFRSGDPDLDRFFARFAGQNQFRHHIGTTYVAEEAGRILGFATVAPGNIESEALPLVTRRALPRYPLPVLRLARLAVAASEQGRGVGSALLRHVFMLALKMAEELGCVGIHVDAKSDAIEFYARIGFSRLDVTEGEIESRPKPTAMFLPLDLIAAAVAASRR
ncbi:MAG TPA: GNAT family N-acetyltransferase [Myxococcaceae bacterium]